MIASDYSAYILSNYETRICEIAYLLYRPCDRLRQFIRTRLNEPQRKSLIKAPRERARSSNAPYVKNFQRKSNRIHGGRRAQVELSRSRNRHDYTRGGSRKRSRGKAEGVRREGAREGAKRGGTKMHFCLHLPVTSEGTSCLGLLSPSGVTTTVLVFALARSSSPSLFPHLAASPRVPSLSPYRRTPYKFHTRAKNAAVIAHVLIIC